MEPPLEFIWPIELRVRGAASLRVEALWRRDASPPHGFEPFFQDTASGLWKAVDLTTRRGHPLDDFNAESFTSVEGLRTPSSTAFDRFYADFLDARATFGSQAALIFLASMDEFNVPIHVLRTRLNGGGVRDELGEIPGPKALAIMARLEARALDGSLDSSPQEGARLRI